jgi:predicted MPP superfamily phosphohydrolase
MLSRRKFIKKSLIYGAGAMAAYPPLIERFAVDINEYNIFVPNLPAEFEGYRVLHFTDLHYGFLNPLYLVRRVIKVANLVKADVIACTGDYVKKKHTTSEIKKVWRELIKLEAKDGVYFVLGNHDHWADTGESLKQLEASGRSLRHKAVSVERNGKRIWFAGAGDLWEDELGFDKALAGVPEGDCRIMLSHNPDSADTDFKERIDLMLSGHTHGGQVDIPFLGPPALPVKNKKYKSGFVKGGNCNLFISRGIGWSGPPVRFNCPPELALLKLMGAEE